MKHAAESNQWNDEIWWEVKKKKKKRQTSFPEHFLIASTVHESQLELPPALKIWTSTSVRWHNLAPITFHGTLPGAVTPVLGGEQPPYCSSHFHADRSWEPTNPSSLPPSLPAWAGPKPKPRCHPRTGSPGCHSHRRVLAYTAPLSPARGRRAGSSNLRGQQQHLSGTLPATPVCCRCYSPAAGSRVLRPLLPPRPQHRIFLSPVEAK